jgi:hypothetical protein
VVRPLRVRERHDEERLLPRLGEGVVVAVMKPLFGSSTQTGPACAPWSAALGHVMRSWYILLIGNGSCMGAMA